MIYAIGVPGWPVRMFVTSRNRADAELQLRSGEVAVPVDAARLGGRVADDGLSIEWVDA